MKIYDFDQCSPEWFEIRKLKLTASHAQAIAANGKGLVSYINDKISDYYSIAEKERYISNDMERGNKLESSASAVYSFETGICVSNVGFCVYNDFVGASPDGIAGEDGLIEIKCPNDKTYFRLLMDKKIDTKYIWQIQMELIIFNKKWCDFVAYNPNFEKHIYIERIYPDTKKIEKLKEGFLAGEKLIKEYMSNYETH